jgi:hypothetical protein
METQKHKEKEEGTEWRFKKIMAKNFPYLERNIEIQIHEAPKSLWGIWEVYITIKLAKVKYREKFKGSRRKVIHNIQGRSIKLKSDLSAEIL